MKQKPVSYGHPIAYFPVKADVFDIPVREIRRQCFFFCDFFRARRHFYVGRILIFRKVIGAKFIREIMSGVYASDYGLWDTDPGAIVRHQMKLGLKNVKLLWNIVPEAAKYLADRPIEQIAKTTVFNNKPDVICVSGITAGAATDADVLARVKNAIPTTAVFANTGCRLETIEKILSIADGAVVGTTFKKDGLFDNHVELDRVKAFMDKVHSIR